MVKYTESQNKVVSTAHTVVAFIVTLAAIMGILWLLVKAIVWASSIVIPIAVAYFMALFFRPYYQWWARRFSSRFLALVVMLLTVLAPVGIVVWLAGAAVLNEFAELVRQVSEGVGRMSARIEAPLLQTGDFLSGIEDVCGKSVGGAAGGTGNGVSVAVAERLKALCAEHGDDIRKAGVNALRAGCERMSGAMADGSVATAPATFNAAASVGWTERLGRAWSSCVGVFAALASGVAGLLRSVFQVLVTVLLFAYFLLSGNRGGGTIVDKLPLLKGSTRKFLAKQMDAVLDILVSFYQRQVMICLIEGVLYGLGFWMVGVPCGFVDGFLLGVFNLVPFMGTVVCLPIALMLARFADGGSMMRLATALVVWGLGQLLDAYFITPKIQGNKTGLGYMGVIISFFLWSALLGPFLGLLLAIPLSACCVVVWRGVREMTESVEVI